ncbi:MAG: hypothetical protein AVDCRST_MAG35-2381 [uncultured Quadrisphaera sp.]|uniref:Uncharacterized protein n=1 Tax=uncultured Quadrisphaera sp. TaxID=904978 RepID=A0A6J4Q194_9ACTN|nr:MAG: hypothetical protein AVDCRST_MAG35-2381 [uncultured Quadrisphaera sp.]
MPVHPLTRGAGTGLAVGLALAGLHTAAYALLFAWSALTSEHAGPAVEAAGYVLLIGAVSAVVGGAVGTVGGWLVGAAVLLAPRARPRVLAVLVVLAVMVPLTAPLPREGFALPFSWVGAASTVLAAAAMAWRAPRIAAPW